MIIFLLSSNFDRRILSNAYHVGINGLQENCHFSDADFGYSLSYEKLKWWTGIFSIMDFILSNSLKNIPDEILIINEDAKPFYNHQSPDFLCSGSIDFSIEKILNLSLINNLNLNNQIIGKSAIKNFDITTESYCNEFLGENINDLAIDKTFQTNGCFLMKTASFIKHVSFLKKIIGLIFLKEFNEQNLNKIDLFDVANILFLKINEKNINL